MLLYKNIDLLEEKEVNIIAHQVNCFKMGSGLAKQIYTKYPIVKKEHTELVNEYANERKSLLGVVQYVQVEKDLYVANCFGQHEYGRENKVYMEIGML